MLRIELQGPQGQKQRHALPPGHYRVGTSRHCDVHIDDAEVSRYHANLVVSEGGGIYLEDAGSTNGTWQGEKRVSGCSMAPGDSVRMGNHKLSAVTDDNRSDDASHSAVRQQRERLARNDSAPVDADKPTQKAHLVDPKRHKAVVEFKSAVHELLLRYLEKHKRSVVGTLSEGELRAEVRDAALRVISQQRLPVPAGEDPESIIEEVVAEAVGLGPLEPFMADEAISEIMVNGPEAVYVERHGRISETGARFNSDASLLGIIERIVTPLGRRIDQGSPMVDARLPDGSRVNAIIPPLALNGPTLTIRKFFKDRLTIDDLIDKGTMSPAIAEFLKVCVRQRKNIVVSGGTGSGKTTTLNVLSNFIPGNERIVTIEDAAELQLHQEHVVTLEARPANVEGKGAVSIRDLVTNALRMRPDRIVVGECRGGEALDMLQAMNTGHDGSLTTGHANSPRDLLARLEVLVLMAGYDLPLRAVREQIASAVDIVVQQTRFSDGKRRITSVMEVTGMEEEVVLTQPIFEFRVEGRAKDGSIKGSFTSTGDVPNFYQQLKQSGVELDWQIFREE